MTLNVQDSGTETSQFMGMHDPSFVAAVPFRSAKSIHLEAEHGFGRFPHPSSMDPPTPETQNHDSLPEAPDGPILSANLWQVHLPDWYPRYSACVAHFVDRAQYLPAVQSLAAYINIRLPCQQLSKPVTRYDASSASASAIGQGSPQVSLRHYIRRLIVTGNDTPAILEAFFGNDWIGGVGNICKQERMNYLFTAKSNGWASTKAAYDILPDEHTPFLRPLHEATEQELGAAEKCWSEWLAMEDWMVGSRSPWESE
ncbi:hypothetical protein BJX70DRAFT_174867 [Aspergillus crustosus]